MAEKVTVVIERDSCTSCAACWSACPEVFEENADDGLSQIVAQYRSGGDLSRGEIPDSLRTSAEDAAASCPVEIIQVQTI